MNETEKERLIKKDLVSIENGVRHAFNQGYEMGMKDREKLNCTDCIIEKSGDFIKSRSEIPNKSEIPTTSCDDAISGKYILDLIDTKGANLEHQMTAEEYRQRMIQAFHNTDCDELIALCVLPTEKEFEHLEWLLKNHNKKEPCGDAISRQAVLDVTWEEPSYTDALNVLTEVRDKVKVLPSITPQQRTGRWIEKEEEGEAEPFIIWECSECHGYQRNQTTFCPNCGAKMEVEE